MTNATRSVIEGLSAPEAIDEVGLILADCLILDTRAMSWTRLARQILIAVANGARVREEGWPDGWEPTETERIGVISAFTVAAIRDAVDPVEIALWLESRHAPRILAAADARLDRLVAVDAIDPIAALEARMKLALFVGPTIFLAGGCAVPPPRGLSTP